LVNIAVVTNTIPNTGVTLPFISKGGTALLILLMEMGVVFNVSSQIKDELNE
jgi:cell division protein FtsW